MTIAPPSETEVLTPVALEPPAPAPWGVDREQVRRVVLRVLLVVLFVALAVVSFETVVTQKYYQVRQSQLFSAWTGAEPRLTVGEPAAIHLAGRPRGRRISGLSQLDFG